jgi:hypothetical protein
MISPLIYRLSTGFAHCRCVTSRTTRHHPMPESLMRSHTPTALPPPISCFHCISKLLTPCHEPATRLCVCIRLRHHKAAYSKRRHPAPNDHAKHSPLSFPSNTRTRAAMMPKYSPSTMTQCGILKVLSPEDAGVSASSSRIDVALRIDTPLPLHTVQ